MKTYNIIIHGNDSYWYEERIEAVDFYAAYTKAIIIMESLSKSTIEKLEINTIEWLNDDDGEQERLEL